MELQGLANYSITYSALSPSGTQQTLGTITLPWSENSVVIHNLNPGTEYRILVSASTSAGEASEETLSIVANCVITNVCDCRTSAS